MQRVADPTLIPLMKNDELDYLKSVIDKLPDNGKIVEWGSGGSTLWYIDQLKPTQYLYSIEHNQKWYNIVNDALKQKSQSNYTYVKFDSDIAEEFYGFARPNEEFPCGLDHYVDPKLDVWDADIFFVDGIARAAVLAAIRIRSTKEDPLVFIHDYRGREFYYDWATQFYSEKKLVGDTLLLLKK